MKIELHYRQMSTHLTFSGFHGILEFDMPTAGEDTKSLMNVWKKTNEQQFFFIPNRRKVYHLIILSFNQ